MLFPGVRRRVPHLPHAIVPAGLAAGSIGVMLLAWAAIGPSDAGDSSPLARIDISTINSIAYTNPGVGQDDLVVQPGVPGMAPQVIASFPNDPLTRSHARGTASPNGEWVAVIWSPALATAASARLSLVSVVSRERFDVEGSFDYLGALEWAPDGSRLALTGTAAANGVRTTTVYELRIESMAVSPVAEHQDAFEVVPAGYSFDGSRRFTVVVDSQGSNLWEGRRGENKLLAELSPGRTAYWSLSPDGARLAFVDILGSGSRRYVGRTLTVATGAITTLPAEGDQFGASWMPGSPLPSFGGPGGSWQLTDPAAGGAYIVPEAWSPSGQALVATVYSAGDDAASRPETAIEIITPKTTTSPSTRFRVSELSGASFLGWVKNLN